MSAVNSTCGRDTAVFTKQFLDRMASPLNQVNIHVNLIRLVKTDVKFQLKR